MANWQAYADDWNQSSFASQVPAPNADPGDAPLVCIQFNQAWLPYMLGSLFQLTQPIVWDPTSAGAADAQQQAQDLMAIIGAAGVCTDMLTFQFTSGCGLQYSVDGGITWIDVPGWDTYAPTCFTGPTGPTGPTGGFDPGIPPIQPGQTTDELACSVAGYIAQQFIQASLAEVVNQIDLGKTVLQAATAIGALIPELNVVLAPILGAAAILYNIVEGGTLSDFSAASTDAVLLSDVTCAIYNATKTDGYVTPANFAAVVAAIGAISYTHADVITALVSYLDAGGSIVLQAVQVPGALAVVNCSACGGPTPDTALFFQGSGTSKMSVANIPNGTGISFMTWYNSSTGGQNANIYYGNKTSGSNAGIQFYLVGGVLNLFVQNASSNVNIAASGALASGNHHIGFAVDNTRMSIFVDGVERAAAVPPAGPWGNGTDGTYIMAGNTGAQNVIAVVWGMATYSSRLLTATFLAAYSAGTFAVPPGSPTHYWPMDDGSGTAVADMVGGNTGTLHAPTQWTTHT